MHIMVVPSWYSSERNKVHGSFFKEQFIALQNSGEKVTVAYNEIWPLNLLGKIKERSGLSFCIEDGLRTYRYRQYNFLPKNPLMFKLFNRRMDILYKEIIKKEGKVDIIHAHSSLWGGISAAYIAKKYNIPFVITEHSSLKYSQYLKESYRKYVYNSYDSADKLIAVGNGLKCEMQDYTNNKIDVIPNMVDLSIFKDNAIYKKDKMNQDVIKLFSLAYLVKGKGMDLLIEAFNNSLKGKNVQLFIGGDGTERKNLENMVKKLQLDKQIYFLGALSRREVVKEMANCDGFVLVSEHETFGMVYIEAMAMGKPVLATKNGGAEDIVNNFNGILADNGNVESISKELINFINKIPKYDNEMIKRKCIDKYNEDAIITNIKKEYNEILNNKGE
ncbi:glycosyltransferase [Clostridium sp. MSJ-8]|uniref:glycosyltransferase n=1 Tax=Clostridium sp. MSJ-8 TaxID=2841510 RepID=UPI001C0F0B39|nr:glycosyltransferase [Clostridium sp. MSJ-8]MBU5487577.1 glycosyltransferase [Clostridium sp. MSJ-8]